ncbi:hypothetical protein L7F22_020784 [Adiantum nelumboides]|nr:hypothetical protein [Adiantum nelumboides]
MHKSEALERVEATVSSVLNTTVSKMEQRRSSPFALLFKGGTQPFCPVCIKLKLLSTHQALHSQQLSSLLLPGFAFVIKMAGRILARKVSSQLPKLCPATSQEQVVSRRAFASAAAKAQDDQATSVEVGRGSTDSRGQAERAVSRQGGQGGQRGVANLGWPGSAIPSLFSPLINSFMRPTSLTQMMDTLDHLSSSFDTATRSGAKSRIPWDVMEDDKCFKLRIDLPGMSKQDVKITVEDGDLVVSAEHESKQDDDEWSASSYGSYHMRIKLPDNVDANGIKAELKDGVLKIRAPKVEGAKQKHQVQIE